MDEIKKENLTKIYLDGKELTNVISGAFDFPFTISNLIPLKDYKASEFINLPKSYFFNGTFTGTFTWGSEFRYSWPEDTWKRDNRYVDWTSLKKWMPELSAVWMGDCPYKDNPDFNTTNGDLQYTSLAHTHVISFGGKFVSGETCTRDSSIIFAENGEPSELMWHEYAHIVDRCKSEHGPTWVKALKKLGKPHIALEKSVPGYLRTGKEVQEWFLSLKEDND